jgi:hypothetical protein
MVAGKNPPPEIVEADDDLHRLPWVHLGNTVTSIAEPQVQDPVTHEGGCSVGADVAEAGYHETFVTVARHPEVKKGGTQ